RLVVRETPLAALDQALAAAAASSSQSVRSRPRAPAAGTSSGVAPRSAAATGSALASPVVINQTSDAAWIAGSVREIRVGGGFGQSCTPTTVRSVSRTYGVSGNSDAV